MCLLARKSEICLNIFLRFWDQQILNTQFIVVIRFGCGWAALNVFPEGHFLVEDRKDYGDFFVCKFSKKLYFSELN